MRWSASVRAAIESGRRTGGLQLFLVLAALSVVFLAGDFAYRRSSIAVFSEDKDWDVARDRSYIEIAGYVQLTIAAVLLLVLARRRTAAPVFAGWSLVLFAVMLDDSLRWHERAGEVMADRWALSGVAGLRGYAVGELLFWSLMGTAILTVLALTYWRSAAGPRRDAGRLLLLLLVLAAFGAGVDALGGPLSSILSTQAYVIVDWLEAAGELLAMTALLAYVVHLLRLKPPFPSS